MTLEEVKAGLKCCSEMPYKCKDCPFVVCGTYFETKCMETMHKSAYKKLVLMERRIKRQSKPE